MRPMIKYRGGKSKEIPQIMRFIPRFKGRYIEPFVGGGAVFFHLEPRQAIINDVNDRLMAFYRGVRDNYDGLRAELDEIERLYAANRHEFELLKQLNPNERVEDKNEALYYALRDMYNHLRPSSYSDALLYYFINKTAYSGMIRFNSNGEFNVPYGRYKSINTNLITRNHHQLLNRTDLYCSDYASIFAISEDSDFMFLDPPYDCTFSDYGNETYKDGFGETEHRRLAQDFRNLSCKALMVIGKTPLTEELYHQYIIDEYDKNYAVNIRNRFKSQAKHIVVANYDRELVNRTFTSEGADYHLETAQVLLFEKETPYGQEDK